MTHRAHDHWWTLALKPKVVLAYYTEPPELTQLEIISMQFHRDAAALQLVVGLPKFPDKPSRRWPTGSKAVQARLRFIDVHEVRLAGWSTTNVGDLMIEPSDCGIRFGFVGATSSLEGSSAFFDIIGITAHVACDR